MKILKYIEQQRVQKGKALGGIRKEGIGPRKQRLARIQEKDSMKESRFQLFYDFFDNISGIYNSDNKFIKALENRRVKFFKQQDRDQFKCLVLLIYKFYPTKEMQMVKMKEICICTLAMYTLVSKTSNKNLDVAMQRIKTEDDFTQHFATYETAKKFVENLPSDRSRLEVYQAHALMKNIPENAMELLNKFVEKVNSGTDIEISWFKKYLYGVGQGVFTIFYATLFQELGFIKMNRGYMPAFKGICGSIRGYYFLVNGRAYPSTTDFMIKISNDEAAKERAIRDKKQFDSAYLQNHVPRMVAFINKILLNKPNKFTALDVENALCKFCVALRDCEAIKSSSGIGPSSLLEEAKKSIAVDIIDLTDDGDGSGEKKVYLMEDVKTSMTSNKKRRFKEDSVTYDEQQSGSSSMSKINKKAKNK